METERLALSQRERDRLRVLHEIRQKQITQSEAARRLKISDRHIRRLLVELGKRGDRAVIHRLRGRQPNRPGRRAIGPGGIAGALQDRLVIVPGSRGPLYESRLTSKVRCESIEFRNGFLRPIRRQCIRDSVRGR